MRWYVKKVRKAESGKEVRVYYINIPSNIATLLREFEPYLDLEKKVIVFRRGEENE